MQLSVPWRYGPKKPFGSIPRINWSHPLATGLASYCLDCGGGVLIDLVSGKQGAVQTAGSPTLPSIVTTPWGQNWQLAAQASGTPGVGLVFGFSPQAMNSALNFPYSFASGFIFQNCPSGVGNAAGIWAVCDTGNNTNFTVNLSGTGVSNSAHVECFYGNAGNSIISTPTVAIGAFTTTVGVTTGTTSCTQYLADSTGLFSVATAAVAAANTASTSYQPIFGDMELTAGGTGSHFCLWGGSVFYGAAWANRALTQTEARQLASDPWCLLWYLEDDIFASLTHPASLPPWVLWQLQGSKRLVAV